MNPRLEFHFKPDQRGTRKALGPLEQASMQIAWTHPPLPGQAIHTYLQHQPDHQRIAYTTPFGSATSLTVAWHAIRGVGALIIRYPSFLHGWDHLLAQDVTTGHSTFGASPMADALPAGNKE